MLDENAAVVQRGKVIVPCRDHRAKPRRGEIKATARPGSPEPDVTVGVDGDLGVRLPVKGERGPGERVGQILIIAVDKIVVGSDRLEAVGVGAVPRRGGGFSELVDAAGGGQR